MNTWIIIALAVIVGFAILRFLSKIFLKIIGFLLIVVLALYLLFYWEGGLLDLGNREFMLVELEQKYCIEKQDTIKCQCIVQPVLRKINRQYTVQELDEMKSNKIRSLRIILSTALDEKAEINACLKEHNASGKWKEFLQDLKQFEFDSDMDSLFQSVERETTTAIEN